MEHARTSTTGPGWDRAPWHATQRAAWGSRRAGPSPRTAGSVGSARAREPAFRITSTRSCDSSYSAILPPAIPTEVRMLRIGLAVILALGLVLARLAAEGQQAGKVARIGMLDTSASDPARVAWWDALRQKMRELGYVEGQNVTFEARFAEGRIERLPALAGELVKIKVDVIVTGGNAAALAAKRATTSIPIVMATGADQVGLGIVAGLARPGGNVTGVTSFSAELMGKRLGLLKDVVPRLSRAAFLLVEGDASSGAGLRDAQAAGGALDLL